jgi:transglutaminase superfamily protein
MSSKTSAPSDSKKARRALFIRLLRRTWLAAICLFACLALYEGLMQWRESVYLTRVAEKVVRGIDPSDTEGRVRALRDYVRCKVAYRGAFETGRPFLRATASETLRSGKGFCGESSRTFICLAHTLDIPAQRINLYGKAPHVVAEAELAPGHRVIVDCQNPPAIRDLEPLDRVMLRPEYDDYYTLNLRRLRVNWIVSRIKLEMGPLTYWTENPHALRGVLWCCLAGVLLVAKWARDLLRICLLKRGWIHVSSLSGADRSRVVADAALPADVQESS